MLGVKLNEEFELNGSNAIYKLSQYGFFFKCGGSWMRASDYLLIDIIRGEYEIKKLPWKPKQNGFYYYVRWYMEQNGKWRIEAKEEQYSRLCANDNMRVDVCNCFKTREDAEEQKYEIFKRLTGKDWHETYGQEGDDNV